MKDGMMDNRKVKDNHQEGIKRVLQKGPSEKTSQPGEMHMKTAGSSEKNWRRAGGSLTPRRA